MQRRDLKLDKYNISLNRYRELLYFCRQYPEWKDELRYNTDCLKSPDLTGQPKSTEITDQTSRLAIRRAELASKCELIEQAAIKADEEVYQYIIKNITDENAGYNYLRMILRLPMGRNQFYEARRRFFWILDKNKK